MSHICDRPEAHPEHYHGYGRLCRGRTLAEVEPSDQAAYDDLLAQVARRRKDAAFRDRLQERLRDDAALLTRIGSDHDPAVPPYCYLDPEVEEDRARWNHWCLDHYEDTALPNTKWSWTVDEDCAVVDVTPSLDCDRCGTHGHYLDGMWRRA